MGKNERRRSAFIRRRVVGAAQLAQAGEDLRSAALPLLDGLAPHSTIAAYASMGTEIPTLPTIRVALDRGLRVLTPKLGSGTELGWGELNEAGELTTMPATARAGLRPDEPRGPSLGVEVLHRARLIVVPALAVDSSGTRLGRGAGWYDRALLHRDAEATIIAVCWPWEVTDEKLPRDDHDIPIDGVLTTRGLTMLTDRESAVRNM
ncbi:MAG: 5-formyltetrahydrofolate cyclo-ligase [Bifidobacterium sp.]|jgi:5-formyltetrahydrofolate cyclo-ligase